MCTGEKAQATESLCGSEEPPCRGTGGIEPGSGLFHRQYLGTTDVRPATPDRMEEPGSRHLTIRVFR